MSFRSSDLLDFCLQAAVQNTWQFCIVIIPHCIFQVIINIIVTSALTVTVSDADSGENSTFKNFGRIFNFWSRLPLLIASWSRSNIWASMC